MHEQPSEATGPRPTVWYSEALGFDNGPVATILQCPRCHTMFIGPWTGSVSDVLAAQHKFTLRHKTECTAVPAGN